MTQRNVCEFCQEAVIHPLSDDTVCRHCDEHMQEEWEKELAEQVKLAAKHGCRMCAAPLTPGRRVWCKVCVPNGYDYPTGGKGDGWSDY